MHREGKEEERLGIDCGRSVDLIIARKKNES